MKSDDTFDNQQCAIAYEEYLEEKERAVREGRATTITYGVIEKRNGLRKDQLKNYFANHICRNKKVAQSLSR